MALQKKVPSGDKSSVSMKPLNISSEVYAGSRPVNQEASHSVEPDVEIDLKEVYFLIMHFLSAGPCSRTCGQLWNELLEYNLLPRRYHAWYSRSGGHSGDENDAGSSFPLCYDKLVERYPHIEKDHLAKLLKQLLRSTASSSEGLIGTHVPSAADVPTFLGTGSFSLLSDMHREPNEVRCPAYMRWPHKQADQVRGLSLREIGGGFSRHHRSPSIRAACYAVAKPSTMVQKMQNIKRVRGHRNAVYCAILDRSGRYVITGSDDRLVKIWSMETAFCLASCRGHEGDITDLAVNSNNALVASSSNDCNIRVWRLPDGLPISVLRGHTGAVTAIVFSPRPSAAYQLLSSADDGTCRVWDARNSQVSPRIYVPRPSDSVAGRSGAPSSSASTQNHQIFCCAYNANGTVFVTGSSDTLARVWNASKTNKDESDQPNHEIDVLCGHENDVNYVQFSGCAVASRICLMDSTKEENSTKFKNSWFSHDNIVTCSRDGSAIIWTPRSRRAHGKIGRWTRAYHLKVPPPPMPPHPPRGGPRQRVLPTPRGVNMIIWSLDNRFVLAAIMDCRICVWNASDGNLVHSLTGHTNSTYVLDVHPFNPRIAMSAGYDGKTIVWDIWEGTPIRIYEISRYKLVDGKFSSDGTSIILSDDVGQLYILSTGQGDSQKDAMYDQFFLGDYRPIVQDIYGNVLDQETQLAPYRRNMQDLLCDSAMTPYEEPYQSMYQRRRLGTMGIEWHPSSLRLAVGPDFSLDPEYQLLPLADLDMPIDPLPEFVDVMDWEPAIDVQSDDNDSEYNVPEENLSGGEQGSLGSNSSEGFGYTDGDSEAEESNKDGLRRSRRRKQKAEVEIMTSSGRRVKRRNLDEGDGDDSSLRNNRTKKSRNGRTKKKSSKLKGLRPQRAAARNALTLFSRITGASSDGEDEDISDSDVLESDSAVEDSRILGDDFDRLLQNQKAKNSKGKEISYEDFEHMTEHQELSDACMNAENKKKLILRLPIRDSNKPLSLERSRNTLDKLCLGVGSSHDGPQESSMLEQNRQFSSIDGNHCRVVRKGKEHEGKIENIRNLTEGYINGKMKWGGVKVRSYKRARWGETASSNPVSESSSCLGHSDGIHGKLNGFLKLERVPEESDGTMMNEVAQQDQKLIDDGMLVDLNIASDGQEKLGVGNHEGENKSLKEGNIASGCGPLSPSGINNQLNVGEDSSKPLPSESNILPGSVSVNFVNSTEPEPETLFNCYGNGVQNIEHKKPSATEEKEVSEAPKLDQIKRIKIGHLDENMPESDSVDRNYCSTSYGSLDLHPHATKTYTAVYRRSKSSRSRKIIVDEGKNLGEQASSINNHETGADEDFHEGSPDIEHRKQLVGPEQSSCDAEYVNNSLKLGQGHEPEETLPVSQKHSVNRHGFPREDWGSCSRLTVRVRSTRNRRASCHLRETSPVNKRQPNQSSRKGSWLLLTSHEEGSRCIPQQGDEVVYLRQGHEEYMQYSLSRESGPWRSLKGKIRAVEFCKVEGLEYSISPGSGESCCKLTLEFTDPTSCLLGKSFKLTLPEVTNFPDFLVEKTRFDAAIKRNWTFRDKCKVWWKNEGEEDGSWWEGRILSLKPKSPDFPDSPWERYTVKYKSDPTETHLHSPWELFDEDTQWEEPCIDDEVRNNLLLSIEKLERSGSNQDRYGIQKLKQVSQKPSFINRFPVPISLEVIQARLENNYYRSVEALKHDIMVMLSNAETQFGRSPELSTKLKRLSDWFKRLLNSL